MGVVRRWQPRPDVKELPDACLFRQVPDSPPEELAVGSHRRPHVRVRADRRVACFPVRREMVLAAKPVVVHPRNVRDARVDLRWLASVVRDVALPQAACHQSYRLRGTDPHEPWLNGNIASSRKTYPIPGSAVATVEVTRPCRQDGWSRNAPENEKWLISSTVT